MTDLDLAILQEDTYSATPAGTVITAGVDRAVITYSTEFTIVSIMGTQTPAQWVSDFKVIGARTGAHPTLGVCEQGFLDGALSIYPQLHALTFDSPRPLILQGHSRGAGMVPILAGLYVLDGLTPGRAVCWEAPWSVGETCRDMVLTAGVSGIQYWHGDDPVPCIPAVPWLVPNVWPLRHFGSWTLDPFASHMMQGIIADLT